MQTAEARIQTERASRYLAQLCKHAASMGTAAGHGPRLHLGGMLARREVEVHTEQTVTQATVTFTPWGQCTITSEATTLTLRIRATDEENLQRIQDIITKDLQRFGRRDNLTVNWHRLG